MANLLAANPALSSPAAAQPQTASKPPGAGVPFSRLSMRRSFPGPSLFASVAFGSVANAGLNPITGYLRQHLFRVSATGGTSTAVCVAAPDAPWSAIASVNVKAPNSVAYFTVSGYSWHLVQKYGGQLGMLGFGNRITQLPSYSGIVTALGAGCGNFNFNIIQPYEMREDGYCSLALQNAAAVPEVYMTLGSSAAVYSTAPTTLPVISVTSSERYWSVPADAPTLAPYGLGSSAQWAETQTVPFNAGANLAGVQLKGMGNWIHTLILILRDATGARQANWPTEDLQVIKDGIQIDNEYYSDQTDEVFREVGGVQETGVLVFSRRRSVMSAISQMDTFDDLLPTVPATNLTIAGTFGSAGTGPYTITCLVGSLLPVGPIPYASAA